MLFMVFFFYLIYSSWEVADKDRNQKKIWAQAIVLILIVFNYEYKHYINMYSLKNKPQKTVPFVKWDRIHWLPFSKPGKNQSITIGT